MLKDTKKAASELARLGVRLATQKFNYELGFAQILEDCAAATALYYGEGIEDRVFKAVQAYEIVQNVERDEARAFDYPSCRETLEFEGDELDKIAVKKEIKKIELPFTVSKSQPETVRALIEALATITKTGERDTTVWHKRTYLFRAYGVNFKSYIVGGNNCFDKATLSIVQNDNLGLENLKTAADSIAIFDSMYMIAKKLTAEDVAKGAFAAVDFKGTTAHRRLQEGYWEMVFKLKDNLERAGIYGALTVAELGHSLEPFTRVLTMNAIKNSSKDNDRWVAAGHSGTREIIKCFDRAYRLCTDLNYFTHMTPQERELEKKAIFENLNNAIASKQVQLAL
ncbi:hypothetical protein FACS189425_10940 [Clostridia bacterium]|nr:hypothetical protein FACS189425_10940 [Clostridia bacterium]